MSPPRVDDLDSAPTPRGSNRGRVLLGLALLPIIYVLAMPVVLRFADLLGRLTGNDTPLMLATYFYAPIIYLYFKFPLVKTVVEAYGSLFPKF